VNTLNVVGMIFLIICGANAFSSILSFTGITEGIIGGFSALPPMMVVISFMMIVLVLVFF